MASGLLLLLDDVAAIAKVAAATLDDVAAATAKAGAKSAGVVIDEAPRMLGAADGVRNFTHARDAILGRKRQAVEE